VGPDYDWNDNYRGFVYPNCVPFACVRTWTLNSYGYGYGDSFSPTCWWKPYSYCYNYDNPFSCSGNTYDYRYGDSFSCSGNTYDYRYGDSFSFSCSTDPYHYYYTFTHRDCDPNGRCIVIGNAYGHLDLYPDSFTYGSGNNNSFVHCSGDSDSSTDRVQYSWPPSFSDGNSVGDQHSFQQSPTCFRQRR